MEYHPRGVKLMQQLLKEFVSIQSVSTDPQRRGEIKKAVSFLNKKLSSLGFKVTKTSISNCPPLILAQKNISPNLPTIAIYGHYDVQPEDPIDEWHSPPFVLTSKNGRLYGRGVADNKGHIIQNIAALSTLIKKKKLGFNIIFLLEGEEEIASLHFAQLIKKHHSLLDKIDAYVVTDVGMHKKGIPQIFYGLRGIIYFELTVSIGKYDLHSGVWGGRVYNPIQVISFLLSSIKDIKSNRILIPHFYDKVRQPSRKEINLLKKIAKTDKEERKEAGVYKLISVDKDYPYLSSKLCPSFDVHGIKSGYTGFGSKTVIPKKASVKFSFRLIDAQDPDKTESLVYQFVNDKMPDGVKWQLVTLGKAASVYTDIDNQFVLRMKHALTKVFGHKTLINRAGGSIPAVEVINRLYQKSIILTGFTLPDDNVHAPNENIDQQMFFEGIKALELFYGQD